MLPWPVHLQEAKSLQETKRDDKTLAFDSTWQVFSGFSSWLFGWSHQSMDKNYTMDKNANRVKQPSIFVFQY